LKTKTDKEELILFRKRQRELALLRDLFLCTLCYYVDGVHTKATDVHHVFGRGTSINSPKEKYVNLISVCRKHHPRPILFKNSQDAQMQLEVLKEVNSTPINPSFTAVLEYVEVQDEH